MSQAAVVYWSGTGHTEAMAQAVAAAALEKVPQAIVDANSVDVDGVSGATLTSGRIKDAAVKCLTQAAQ